MRRQAIVLGILCAAMTMVGCATPPRTAPEPTAAEAAPATAQVMARMQTMPLVGNEPNSSVLVRDAAGTFVVGSAALGGIEVYDLAGKRLGATPSGEVASVDVSYGVSVRGQSTTVLAAIDTTTNSLRFFTMAGAALAEIGARAVPLGFAAEGVCLYVNPRDRGLYAFVVGDGGEVDQHLVYVDAQGRLDARQVRRIGVPSPLTQCVADSANAMVYAAEEGVGIWRFSADPESDLSAALVDSPGRGHLEEEVGGVALYDGGEGARWLLASDATAGRINVYDREDDARYLGSFTVGIPGESDTVEEPGPLHATNLALGSGIDHGLLLVADEDGLNYKALSIADIAAALGLAPGTPQSAQSIAAAPLAVVTPAAETVPVPSYGDAADDPAIWAHPTDPALSLVLATDKKSGLHVYDMQGRVLQYLPDGKMNNVDLREGFSLGGKEIVLVTASDRTRKAIAIYRLDTQARRLVDVADGMQPTDLDDPYGLCMYRSATSGKTYVFINSGEGPLNQWELVDAGNGRVRAELVRELMFDTQTEGCVADDAAGVLFINEEDVALWKLSAEPDGGTARIAIARVGDNPAIKDDLEGIGMYELDGGRGYLVLSSQGNDTYAVYRREGEHAYVGSFAVVADGARGIDGISETDGLDVSSRNLGPGYAHGAMVAQDGRNVLPVENQNYKIVSWEAIARALGLEMR